MTTYICRDLTIPSVWIPVQEECGCEYREVSPGVWQTRYQGPGFGRIDWTIIEQTSLEEIRVLGHNPVAMDQA